MTSRSWVRKLFARTPRTLRKAARRPRLEALDPTGGAGDLCGRVGRLPRRCRSALGGSPLDRTFVTHGLRVSLVG
jgi:hypothetical protein